MQACYNWCDVCNEMGRRSNLRCWQSLGLTGYEINVGDPHLRIGRTFLQASFFQCLNRVYGQPSSVTTVCRAAIYSLYLVMIYACLVTKTMHYILNVALRARLLSQKNGHGLVLQTDSLAKGCLVPLTSKDALVSITLVSKSTSLYTCWTHPLVICLAWCHLALRHP